MLGGPWWRPAAWRGLFHCHHSDDALNKGERWYELNQSGGSKVTVGWEGCQPLERCYRREKKNYFCSVTLEATQINYH